VRVGVLLWMPDAEVVQVPVSDGGEGWLESWGQVHDSGQNQATCPHDSKLVEVNVKDPLMRTIVAQYLMKGDTAVIEIVKASGLTLLSKEERNPMVATSYGTGQLVVDAVRKGCKRIIVGLGGSATSDCGIGMLRAIIDSFAKQGSWDDVHQLDDVRFSGRKRASEASGTNISASRDEINLLPVSTVLLSMQHFSLRCPAVRALYGWYNASMFICFVYIFKLLPRLYVNDFLWR